MCVRYERLRSIAATFLRDRRTGNMSSAGRAGAVAGGGTPAVARRKPGRLSDQEPEKEELPHGAVLVCGALAGALSAAATCPIDVIKTRIQVPEYRRKGSLAPIFFATSN